MNKVTLSSSAYRELYFLVSFLYLTELKLSANYAMIIRPFTLDMYFSPF